MTNLKEVYADTHQGLRGPRGQKANPRVSNYKKEHIT